MVEAKRLYDEIEEKMMEMIGGKQYDKYAGEGALLLAFVWSFHYF